MLCSILARLDRLGIITGDSDLLISLSSENLSSIEIERLSLRPQLNTWEVRIKGLLCDIFGKQHFLLLSPCFPGA